MEYLGHINGQNIINPTDRNRIVNLLEVGLEVARYESLIASYDALNATLTDDAQRTIVNQDPFKVIYKDRELFRRGCSLALQNP